MSIGRIIYKLYINFIQPIAFLIKRNERLSLLGFEKKDNIRVIKIEKNLSELCNNSDECNRIMKHCEVFLSGYRSNNNSFLNYFKGTTMLIETKNLLDSYHKQLNRSTKRAIAKTKKNGYYTRFFDPDAWNRAIDDIYKSKLFRSGGIVPFALFKKKTL